MPTLGSTLYIETTIISYLTARPSKDLVQRAHQRLTRAWWRTRRSDFELYVSPLVLQEAAAGDPTRARRRLAFLRNLPVLGPTPDAIDLSRTLIQRGAIPKKAEVDALHIAIAAVNGIEYLLTWNCSHIANARMRSKIETVCRVENYEPPVLCTPEELMED
jgi:predicted nucleic acid-binding protein